MIKKLHLNISHVFTLVALIFLSFTLFEPIRTGIFLYGRPNFQLELVLLLIIMYMGFSLSHHYFDKSLTFEATLEYILMALLVIVILTGAI